MIAVTIFYPPVMSVRYNFHRLLHKMIARFFLIVMAVLSAGLSQQPQQIDLNRATFEEIVTLPIDHEQAKVIYERIIYQGPFTSVYDLLELEEIDNETFLKIKPLVMIMVDKETEKPSRLQDMYRKVEQWTAIEGANEGLIDVWLDRLSEPVNVNTATYDELITLQNVSPVDAVAVIKKQERGKIRYTRDLRGSPGLSYWGYRNMVDFVTFDTTDTEPGTHLWYNLTYKTVPSTTSFDEESEAPGSLRNYPPDMIHKLTYTSGRHFKLYYAYHRQLGEDDRKTKIGNISLPDGKIAVGFRNFTFGPLFVDRFILGNFSATIGQGVVFESTDFWSPRRSGYGWSKRTPGVFADISRTREYALRGLAFQGNLLDFQFLGFLSKHPRDAVINPGEDSFTALITMYPRRDSVSADGLMMPLTNTVEEVTWGGNVKYSFFPGTFFGFSSYESLYDKELAPDVKKSVIADDNKDKYLTQIGNAADTEIEAMYSSKGTSPLWSKTMAVRRVLGFEFSAVIRNLAIQGEYGILDKNGKVVNFRGDPAALLVNAYLQFNNLNLLAVYRDYDLGYDNSYQRSFSNYQRYKSTIFEDTFYLKDPVFGYLYSGIAQPQAERGIYFSSRYQFHRQWVTTNQFDTWTRIADKAKYYRIVSTWEYRPVFNYRFRIRQKWQQRGSFNPWSPTTFFSNETRIQANLRLSRYDNVRLLYVINTVQFSPRRRLTQDLLSGGEDPSMVGSASLESEAMGFTATHNFSGRFKIIGSVLMYKGFFWNFEDTDFRVFDSLTDALRWWVTFFTRVGDRWAIRFKISSQGNQPVTNHAFEPPDSELDGRLLWENIRNFKESSDFRLQLDYAY